MAHALVTPLQPREFFSGIWHGEGELTPSVLVRWLVPRQHVTHRSRPIWLTETIWMVEDRFAFSSGQVIESRMFAQLVTPDRIHVTADDMPLGADIMLHQQGFRFTPYVRLVRQLGRLWRVRCRDECWIDVGTGLLYDTIRVYLLGIHLGTLHLTIRREASS